MGIVLLCRRMRWTYQQYRSQPSWFLDILELVEELDGEKSQEEFAEAKRLQQTTKGQRRG